MEQVSTHRSHGGMQGVCKHAFAETGTETKLCVFVPEQQPGSRLPVPWYRSGLTCSHADWAGKGEYRRGTRHAKKPSP